MKYFLMLSLFVMISLLSHTPAQTANDYLKSGNTKMDNKDYDGAIADFTKAISLNPNFSAAYCNRADCKVSANLDYYGAIADYNRAIEIDPNNGYAWYGRWMVKAVYLNDQAGACQDYDKAYEYGSKDPYVKVFMSAYKCN